MKKISFVLLSVLIFSCKKQDSILKPIENNNSVTTITFTPEEQNIIDSLNRLEAQSNDPKNKNAFAAVQARLKGEDCEGYNFNLYKSGTNVYFDFRCRVTSSPQFVYNIYASKIVIYKDDAPYKEISINANIALVNGTSPIMYLNSKFLDTYQNLPSGSYKAYLLYRYSNTLGQYISTGYLSDQFIHKNITPSTPYFIDNIEPKPVYGFRSDNVFIPGGAFFSEMRYTVSSDEFSYCKNDDLRKFMGVAFYAYEQQVSQSVPVYSYYSPSLKDQILTTIQDDAYYQNNTYTNKTIAFYAFSTQIPGTVPLYRYNNKWLTGGRPNHYIAFSQINVLGVFEDIAFYAYTN